MPSLRSFCLGNLLGICLVFLLGTFSYSVCQAADVPTKDSTAQTLVEFGDRHFRLAFKSEKEDESLKEYLPSGEKIEHWNELMTVHVFPKYPKENAVEKYHESLTNVLKAKKPASPFMVLENDKTKQKILDLLMVVDNPERIAEWNL